MVCGVESTSFTYEFSLVMTDITTMTWNVTYSEDLVTSKSNYVAKFQTILAAIRELKLNRAVNSAIRENTD